MHELTRPTGLRISVPDTYRIEESAAGPAPRRRSRSRRPSGPISLPQPGAVGGDGTDTKVLLQALEGQDMQLVDSVELQPQLEATPPVGRRRAGAPPVPETQQAEIELAVGADEDAVVLLEQNGVYSWNLPQSSEIRQIAPAASGVRRRGPAEGKTVRFVVEIRASREPASQPGRRGLISDLVYDRVKVYVLKFVAKVVVGSTVRFLERNVRRGLIGMTGLDPAKWLLAKPSEVKLPRARPARILLFVHGTFSSTIGSYGALCGTPWGQAFLAAAVAHYDAILGFDHATLSDDPATNASELLAALEALSCKQPPQIDVVAFSRGGLVYRSLVEHLLPRASFKCRMSRAIFVACTNRGTQLANPDNWHLLVDLYTNIATASFRLLSLIPQATAASLILKELVQSLGTLVKYLATNSATDIPGLAAMQPDGEFVTTLNQMQPGQPQPAHVAYYAVTSEFRPELIGGDHRPRELPLRLVMALADGLVDHVMNEANDLVVNTSSMTAIDKQIGGFVRDALAFGTTPLVYHTSYFTRPEVVNALTRWLELPPPPTVELGPLRRGRGVGAVPRMTVEQPLTAPRLRSVPSSVDTDIVLTDATATVSETRTLIEEKNPSYVVVGRDDGEERFHYAVRTEEMMDHVRTSAPETTLLDALDLHEGDRSEPESLDDVHPVANPGSSRPHARRGVVLVNEQPIGVVPYPQDAAAEPDVVELARIASAPASTEERAIARRAMPTFSATEKGAVAAQVTCHFLAEMEQEVLVNHTATIEVSVSSDAIALLPGRASATGIGEVDPTRKLLVQVIPKANFVLAGDKDRIEIDPPGGGDPVVIYFDVKAAHQGDGEVWIIVRQRQMGIARLELRPKVVDRKQAAARRAVAETHVAEAPRLEKPLDQLTIFEQTVDDKAQYQFELELPSVNLFEVFHSKPLQVKRDEYVKALYKEIEDRYLSTFNQQTKTADVAAFTAELRGYGAELFEELLPREMQAVLWQHRDHLKSIRVVSSEPFIPWELVHLKEPGQPLDANAEPLFLGQMGLVRWLHNVNGLPPLMLHVRPDKACYVVPDYPHPDWQLPEAAKERQYLVDKFTAKPVEPQPNSVQQLLKEAGSFDLLHFACHGEAAHDNITRARVVLEGRVEGPNFVPAYLNASTVEQYARLRGPDGSQPIVVLNACQVGRLGYKLTGIGGFAQAFLRAGAGAFVGTLWSVGDTPARIFTEAFYDELLDGKSVAEATTAARAKARADGDATWLAYVVYAHPEAKLTLG